ncbi:hypothetical protein LOAG_08085 [Loa loa]|uniref:Uncharacterized protein n=1 Tax=Loa loa TaxID=7209 RepID=A0A1S0TUY0_LOALO|nr:hypothetical protein LOAG_08085 [Loa loa]EFO20405.1 hypothetical protein LOAG_08085 [Loa loa]
MSGEGRGADLCIVITVLDIEDFSLWASTKIVRGMNWVEIATAGCRVTGTSKSGIASDILAVDGLGSIRRPNVAIGKIINKLEIKQINLPTPTLISRIWDLEKEIKIKTVID